MKISFPFARQRDRCAIRCGRLFKTPARSRCRLKGKRASQKPFDGDPYTRLATAESADLYMEQGCVRFKAHMTSGLNRLIHCFLRKR